MTTLARICETLKCDITDVIELVKDEPAIDGGKDHDTAKEKNKRKLNREKILTYLSALAEYGTRIGNPIVKHIDGSILFLLEG